MMYFYNFAPLNVRNKMGRLITAALLACAWFTANAQLQFSADYIGKSDLEDKDDNKQGEGSMTRLNAQYTQRLSMKMNEQHQPTAWMLTLNAKYASLNNKEGAEEFVPDEILNASANVTHLRPLSDKWSLMASLGLGIYAMPDDICLRSVQANGGAIFIYKVKSNLDLGVGAGLTNAYGMPGILPMFYLKWVTTGLYEVDLSMVNGMKLSVNRNWSDKFSTRLVAFDMDGMSAVVKDGSTWKVYSTNLTRSLLQAEYRPAGNVSLYAGIGCVWRRSSRLTDRKFKNFYKMFSDNNRKHFKSAMTIRVGADIKF